MPKRTDTRQAFTTTVGSDDTLTIKVVGRWNLIAVEAKYEGPSCTGTIWYEPVEKSGAWGSITAIGLATNNYFNSASNLLWQGKLPLQDNRINKIIAGLRGGEATHNFSMSILLEEKDP